MTHPEPSIFLSHIPFSYPSFTSQRRVTLLLLRLRRVCMRHHFKQHPLRRKHVAVPQVPIKISYVLVSDQGSHPHSLFHSSIHYLCYNSLLLLIAVYYA